MPYITIDDVIQLYYEEEGNGKPLLFIHPPGMGSMVFANQRALSSDFRVITYDMRGNGKSSPSNCPISIPLLAEDIKRLFDTLELERAVVCSYSNGGSTALEFALRYPHHVEQLILIGGFSEVSTIWLHAEFLLGIYIVKGRAVSFLAKVLGQSHGKNTAEKKAIAQYVKLANKNDLLAMYKEGLTYCCTNRLSQLTMPLLLIYGACDYYMHPYEALFTTYAPHAKVVYIEKARHQIPTKHFCELNAIIKTYCLT
ncbi:alpha/beta fold hydrolase [Thermaerobacillus caldiproteolyticus]|uniref:Pimeloyl-ACP methyl ester carboxylesterase n=1 Tax=Thermaerobacillus caldiproteolyticus TaxID=247480 RepID=A0A7V9Z560_9BACL|nr:alpha/beta hydrolase [Anoxybacillus caldiproteolyticus]MBA2874216.1 pimeloyl-ACP methyl ester carboxylesterase [Anoxybacillus caldiproteolyticus]QPA31849.1 alpha/beta hydrolase [Anoxybacillus caldiproteolyticus]